MDDEQIPDSLMDKFESQAGAYRPLPDDIVCIAQDIPARDRQDEQPV